MRDPNDRYYPHQYDPVRLMPDVDAPRTKRRRPGKTRRGNRHDNRHRDFEEDCRFPESLMERDDAKQGLLFLAGLGLLVAISIQIFLFVLMVRNLNTNRTGFEADSPEFPLYKNTVFKNCSSFDPDPALCEMVAREMAARPLPLLVSEQPNGTFLTQDYFPWDSDSLEWDSDTMTYNFTYNWCEAVRCFKGYKVIPSSPYPSAYLPNRFTIWDSGNMAAVAYLISAIFYVLRSLSRGDKPCRGLRDVGIIGWILFVYTLVGPFGWWWYSFISSCVRGWWYMGSMSFAAWSVTWHQVYELQFHPYSCAMSKHPKLAQWTLGIARFLVFAQWVATSICVFIWFGWDMGVLAVAGYQCLESEIAAAPGTSPCSPQYLCSEKYWMRISQTFWSYDTVPPGSWIFVGHYAIATVAVILPHIWALVKCVITCSISKLRPRARDLSEIPLFAMLVAVLYILVFGYLYIATGGGILHGKFSIHNRYSSVAIDEECHAVHVSLSPWRHYMDVDTWWRPVWLAKAWMNA